MRLIDADKLIEPGYTDMFDEPIRFDMVSRYAIETAPTVQAIPVEWIEKYAKRFIELENRNYFAYKGFSDTGKAILYMLEEWEKENE